MRLTELTTESLRTLLDAGAVVALVPVGSVEPHGPHLPLATDTIISEKACMQAAEMLDERGVATYLAPSIPYGVTEFAAGFRGAIGVEADVLTVLLRALVWRFIDDGWSHVCLVNNHLEPAQDEAVHAAIHEIPRGLASIACPLNKRWGRMLSDEFKRGECHAGRYETSFALAAGAEVREEFAELPPVSVSLSDQIKQGKKTFSDMWLHMSYSGSHA